MIRSRPAVQTYLEHFPLPMNRFVIGLEIGRGFFVATRDDLRRGANDIPLRERSTKARATPT
jgi:hypothetical protein